MHKLWHYRLYTTKGKNIRIGATGNGSKIKFYTTVANTGYSETWNSGTLMTQSFFDESYDQNNDNPAMVIDHNSNVGIGTNDPQAKLEIKQIMEVVITLLQYI